MPLFLDTTPDAQAEVSAAIEYARITGGGDEAAVRFAQKVADAFLRATLQLADEIADNETGKPFDTPDEAASIRWGQPVYRLRVETAMKRRRGSSAGLWYAYYSLRDTMGTGKPDTLRIHAFRHSTARPITQFAADGDRGDGTDGGTGE